MQLCVDVRERDLIAELNKIVCEYTKSCSITILTKSLPLGDIIIRQENTNVNVAADEENTNGNEDNEVNEENTNGNEENKADEKDNVADEKDNVAANEDNEVNEKDLFVIERKSISDLLSSVHDGRYREQSHRLGQVYASCCHKVIYLLEGSISSYSPAQKKIIYGAITSLYCFSGFGVMRSMSLSETAHMLLSVTCKIHGDMANGRALYSSGNETKKVEPYSAVVKSVKKQNIHKENIGEIMLAQVPGISPSTAANLLQPFQGSLPAFLKQLQLQPDMLQSVQLSCGNGKKRKLAKTLQATLLQYFS